jgi:hypothetical protein
MNRKIGLRNKLISMKMSIFENVTSYFMRITKVCDKLVVVGEKVDLVNVELNGFPKS